MKLSLHNRGISAQIVRNRFREAHLHARSPHQSLDLTAVWHRNQLQWVNAYSMIPYSMTVALLLLLLSLFENIDSSTSESAGPPHPPLQFPTALMRATCMFIQKNYIG
jgi:hypothetical protein